MIKYPIKCTFEEFILKVNSDYLKSKKQHIRLGQLYVNVLNDVHLELYRKMIDQEVCIDPYYSDEYIPAFLVFCGGNWNEV